MPELNGLRNILEHKTCSDYMMVHKKPQLIQE